MAKTGYELPFVITSDMGPEALARAIQTNFEHLAGVLNNTHGVARKAGDAAADTADHADRMEDAKVDKTNPAGLDIADDDSLWGIGLNPPLLYFSITTQDLSVAIDSGPVLGTWTNGTKVKAVSPGHSYSFRADRPLVVYAIGLVQARQATPVNFNLRMRITLEDTNVSALTTSDATGQYLPNDGQYREFVNIAKFQVTPAADTDDLLLRWELQQDDPGAATRNVDLGDRKMLVFVFYDPSAGSSAAAPAWVKDAATSDAYYHNG